MAPWPPWVRLILLFEDHIVQSILRIPAWHRFVGRIHRIVHERRFGRDPNQPLRQGEATEDPRGRFWRHFVRELGNQAKGKPTTTGTAVEKYVKR